jgi:7-carboxy-7-deazaguanine synthase
MYASWNARGRERTVDDLIDEVNSYPTRFCVLTGGEPMLAKNIHILAKRLVDCGKHLTVETSATILPQGIDCSLASISPKLNNSTPGKEVSVRVRRRHETLRLQPDIIREWIDHYDCQLKFVICSSADIPEVMEFLDSLDRKIAPEKVLLMPEGVDVTAFATVADTIITACKDNGFRYCDRLHIRLYGNKRGR